MRFVRWMTVMVVTAAIATGSHAVELPEQPILSGMEAFKPSGSAAEQMAQFTEVNVAGQTFTSAIQARISGSPANRWDVMLQAPLGEAVPPGATYLARFWVRAAEAMAESGMVGLAIELNRDPWTKLAEGQYNAPREWTLVQLPFQAKQAFDAGTVNVNLRLGYPSQTLEIGGFELVRLPDGTSPQSVARTANTYRGMEADAPWRAEAMERIDRIRKANLTVSVRDSAGKPVAGQAVRVRLTRHQFRFGSAVDGRLMLAETADAEQYRAVVESSFNTVVYENDLKWNLLEADPRRYDIVDQTLPWFAERNIDVRGHVLIWPAFRWLPPKVVALKDDPAALWAAVNEHVTALVTRYRGKLKEWDVLNEPFTNRDLENILGREAFVDWFKLARAADPEAKLFINDFGILASGNRIDTEHQKHYEELIEFLLSKGAPIDGIGMQGHFGSAVTDPPTMLAILDRFGRFGVPIRITELDANMLDPAIRASFLRDVFIVCFSHPSVDGVLQWGFWEGRHWLPDAALYTRTWDLRRNGQAWKSLMAEWTTDQIVVTGPDGSATIRGFLGDYAIEIAGVQQATLLPLAGGQFEFILDE